MELPQDLGPLPVWLLPLQSVSPPRSQHSGVFTQEAFLHQPSCPNIHKCFGTSVLETGTLSPEGDIPPNRAHSRRVQPGKGLGIGGEGLGKTPKSPQAKPGNMVPLQGIFTSSQWVTSQNLEQDGNMRALAHRFPPPPPPHTHILGAQHKHLEFSTQALALLTLHLPPQAHLSSCRNGCPAPLPTLGPTLCSSSSWSSSGQAACAQQLVPRVAQGSRPPPAPVGRLEERSQPKRAEDPASTGAPATEPSPRAPAGTPPAGRRGLRTPQLRSPESPGPSQLRRGPSLCRLCFPARLDLSRLTS